MNIVDSLTQLACVACWFVSLWRLLAVIAKPGDTTSGCPGRPENRPGFFTLKSGGFMIYLPQRSSHENETRILNAVDRFIAEYGVAPTSLRIPHGLLNATVTEFHGMKITTGGQEIMGLVRTLTAVDEATGEEFQVDARVPLES